MLISSISGAGRAKCYAKPDADCAGAWSIEMIKNENYTPWHSYTQNPSYPIKLELKTTRASAAIFTDNKGRDCSIGYLNDEENELVVFRHCLKGKYPHTIPTHYKIKCSGNKLTGKIVSFKDLFGIKGVRVEN